MSDFKPVNQPITPASADPGEEFPFLHTITVVDRVVSVDNPELVQNNIRTETVTLNLDSEWDGLSCIINIGSGKTPTSLIWIGQPVVIPAELMTDIGTLNVSVVGYGDDGALRAVTKKADAIFTVVASGYVEGDEPVPDPTTILGQLIQAADNANQAADRFNQASEDIGDISDAVTDAKGYADAAKTSETNADASATAAQQAVDGLQTTVKELEQNINSFKTTVSETYTTKDEFNALEIGGTNLIRNSDFSNGTSYWAAFDGNSGLKSVTDDVYGHHAEFSAVNGGRIYYDTSNVWENGQVYAYSFYAKASINGARIQPSQSIAHWGTTHSLTTEWKRYTGTITCGTTNTTGTLSFSTRNSATYYIARVKLEKGTKPTAWSPAPEDFDGKYTSKTEFKQILSNYVPLSTYQALEARVQALEAKLANK